MSRFYVDTMQMWTIRRLIKSLFIQIYLCIFVSFFLCVFGIFVFNTIIATYKATIYD